MGQYLCAEQVSAFHVPRTHHPTTPRLATGVQRHVEREREGGCRPNEGPAVGVLVRPRRRVAGRFRAAAGKREMRGVHAWHAAAPTVPALLLNRRSCRSTAAPQGIHALWRRRRAHGTQQDQNDYCAVRWVGHGLKWTGSGEAGDRRLLLSHHPTSEARQAEEKKDERACPWAWIEGAS